MATSDGTDNSNISNNIDWNQIIDDAIKGDEESLNLVRFSEWFTIGLDEISTIAAYRYRLDAAEIRDAVFDKLSDKIQTINNPRKSPLTECLLAWSRKTAKRICLNKIRHNRVKKNHVDRLMANENSNGTRVSTEGIPKPLPSPKANSPEQIHLEKEAAALREKVRTDVYLKVKRSLAKSSPTDLRIVICWALGKMTLKQISEATGIPISTVQRHLVAWQKQILTKTILQQFVSKNPKHRGGAYEMIENAIKKFTRAA